MIKDNRLKIIGECMTHTGFILAEEPGSYQWYVSVAFSGYLCMYDSLLIKGFFKALGDWKLSSSIDLSCFAQQVGIRLNL